MHDHVDHATLSTYAVEKVNVPKEKAKSRRDQVAYLRTRLESYIKEHPDYDLVKMRGSGSVAKRTAIKTSSDTDVAAYVRAAFVGGLQVEESQLLSWLLERCKEVYGKTKDAEDFKISQHAVGITKRARLEWELRAGAQARLQRVAELLGQSIEVAHGALTDEIAKLEGELAKTAAELEELAKGIHPRVLADGGLAATLPELGARAGLPVRIDVDSGRLPPPIEAALYFVCSEAVTNAAKYARAANMSVVVSRQAAQIVAEISDDGVGGADPGRGSGLRGLADRVETLGGTLAIDSPPSAGTRIRAAIPLDDDRGGYGR